MRFIAVMVIFAAAAAAWGAGKTIDIAAAGGIGDGVTSNTAIIQKAIDECSGGGGGTVVFSRGRFVTGTIQIKSNVTLRVERDAALLGSTDAAEYRNLDPFIDGSGNAMGHALIVGIDADHVGIEGDGVIDGRGPQLAEREKEYVMRPFLVRWVRCGDVTVKGVRLEDPGAWTLNFFQTRRALIEDVTIRSRGEELRNNDGINIDSSESVTVRNCDVVSGDDALVVKSTSAGRVSRDISAVGCKLSSRTNAIKLGTESIGGFDHISVKDCQIVNTDMAGIALYCVDGGDLQNVEAANLTMDGVMVPICIRLGARMKTFRAGDKARTEPGKLRDISIHDVTARDVGMIGMLISGVPGHPIEGLTLRNIDLEVPGGRGADWARADVPEEPATYPEFDMFGYRLAAYGIYARHVRGMTMRNVRIKPVAADERAERVYVDVK